MSRKLLILFLATTSLVNAQQVVQWWTNGNLYWEVERRDLILVYMHSHNENWGKEFCTDNLETDFKLISSQKDRKGRALIVGQLKHSGSEHITCNGTIEMVVEYDPEKLKGK